MIAEASPELRRIFAVGRRFACKPKEMIVSMMIGTETVVVYGSDV